MEEMRRYNAVIFDLDGTLLDTLADLTDSVNEALSRFGLPGRTLDEVREFVGNGARRLMQRAVPEGEAHPAFEQILGYFREYYGAHCMERTEPYPGILSLLDWLKKEDFGTAIVSNKPDSAVKKLSDVYFRGLIDSAVGDREGFRRKPAPDSVLQALSELGTGHGQAVYVGDSDVDLETARNAGMDYILVSWGFRSREFLIDSGASPERIISDVGELRQLLLRQTSDITFGNPKSDIANYHK